MMGCGEMERLDAVHHHAAVVAAVTSKPDDQGKSKEAIKHTTKERVNGTHGNGRAVAGRSQETILKL
jgi:hypothetical protein